MDIFPDKDATISASYPDSNYGIPDEGAAGSHLCVGYDSFMFAPGGLGHMMSFLHFDLSSIPKTRTIAEAKLILKFQTASLTGEDFTIKLFDLLDNWGESTVTWNNAPSAGTEIAALTDNEFSNPEFDITDAVRNWHDCSVSNEGILI